MLWYLARGHGLTSTTVLQYYSIKAGQKSGRNLMKVEWHLRGGGVPSIGCIV